MQAERVNIPPSIRMEALVHYGHRCIYCGATSKDAKLQVDHVIPVSRGGTNEMGNLVVACQPCNIGKGKRMLLEVTDGDAGVYVKPQKAAPVSDGVPDAAWRESSICRDPLSEWAEKFLVWWDHVDTDPMPVSVNVGESESTFLPTLFCEGRDGCDIGPETRVLITGWRRIGKIPVEEQMQIRNAVISGYDVPTMIIMGVPDCFYAVLVNERYKGTPRGRVVNEFLQPFGVWHNCGWYPDEDGLFEDLRSPFSDQLFLKQWDFQAEDFRGVYSSCEAWGL